ncbi:MAG: MFS transporter, partial [Theionarchaea archaeon]|nr:MFS transporter [Theionarchaea archaeon]
RKHLGLFYLSTALESTFSVVWVYWIVYLLDQGFSYSVIGVALAINGLSMAICEVPTGALADAVSRKFSVIVGLIGFALALLTIPSITNPHVLIVVFAIWGLPITLISGAAEAWVVDNLRAENREDLIKEYYVKNTSLYSLGSIVAALLSGLIVSFLGMDALWYINGVAILGAVLVLIVQKEHFERKKIHIYKNVQETYTNIREGALFSLREKNVLYIMVAIFFVGVGGELLLICYKPFMEVVGVPREYFGYLSAISGVFCVVLPFLATHLVSFFKSEKYYLSVHSLIFGILLAVVIFVDKPGIAAALFMILLLRQATLNPVLDPFFQEFLPQRLRATVGSFRNMVFSAALLVGDFAISAFTDMTGPQVMLAVGGIIMLPSIIFFMNVKPNLRAEES